MSAYRSRIVTPQNGCSRLGLKQSKRQRSRGHVQAWRHCIHQLAETLFLVPPGICCDLPQVSLFFSNNKMSSRKHRIIDLIFYFVRNSATTVRLVNLPAHKNSEWKRNNEEIASWNEVKKLSTYSEVLGHSSIQ